MMKILHLLWIVPLSSIAGFLTAALLCASKEDN
jgi:hypothetical protein